MAAGTMELSDTQKIAILLASLDEKVAATILQQLSPDVMTRVADAIRNLGIVPGDIRDRAISDCLSGILEMGNVVQGDEQTVNALLTRAIGEKRTAALLQEKTGMAGREAMAVVADTPDEQLAALLAREQVSIVATVVRYLPPEKSAGILKLLPGNLRTSTLVFLCNAQPPSPDAVARIEQHLAARIGQVKKTSRIEEGDRLEIAAAILQHVDKSIEEELLMALDQTDEKLGADIRDRLFTFEDIVKLNDVAVRRLLQEVDMTMLAIGLRGASIALREKFFRNMSKRAGEGLKEEMEFSQKMRLSEVQARQKEVVNVIRNLQKEGQIVIGEAGKDEYV